MSEQSVMLKVLLREKHWQNYSTFCAEYDKAARRIDPDLAGRYPSRAQLHRWINGAVRSLPYADHCRVLEEMFPGWTAEQLFQPSNGDRPLTLTGLSAAAPPASVVLSTGLRPYIEQAFTREVVRRTHAQVGEVLDAELGVPAIVGDLPDALGPENPGLAILGQEQEVGALGIGHVDAEPVVAVVQLVGDGIAEFETLAFEPVSALRQGIFQFCLCQDQHWHRKNQNGDT